jgi:hypothetical protein
MMVAVPAANPSIPSVRLAPFESAGLDGLAAGSSAIAQA